MVGCRRDTWSCCSNFATMRKTDTKESREKKWKKEPGPWRHCLATAHNQLWSLLNLKNFQLLSGEIFILLDQFELGFNLQPQDCWQDQGLWSFLMTGPLGPAPCKTLLSPIKEVHGILLCWQGCAAGPASTCMWWGEALDCMHVSVHFPSVSLTSCVAWNELSNFFMFSSL